jgi:tetratricopeptide (TPR) repeat protein
MLRNLDRIRFRSLCACAFASALFATAALIGCTKRDSLHYIRERQDRGEFEATIEPLRDLLRERPDSPEVNFLYGHALVATNRQSLATWALRKAMEDPDWTVRAGLELASAALAGADFNEAVAAAERVLDREPDNVEALLVRANAHAYWRKDPARALADAARVLELDPDSLDAMKPRILALLALQKTDEAREAIADLGRRIDERDAPEATRSWYCVTQATFADESRDAERAGKLWPDCLAKYPTVPDVVFSAVKFYDGRGDANRATEVLRTALAGDPKSQTFRSALAERLRVDGNIAEGDALLSEVTSAEDPSVAAVAWIELGRFRRNAMDPAGAAEAMTHAYDLMQKSGLVSPQLPFEYAEVLMLSRQFDRALEIAAHLTVPAHQHLIRARVEQERGNPKAALAEFDETFRLWPDNPWARYYAARAAENAGDFDRALEEYRTSIRIDGGLTDARTRAAALLLAEGKPRMASQMLRQPSSQPLDPAGELLVLRIEGYGSPAQIKKAQAQLDRSDLSAYAAAIVELARGASEAQREPKAGLVVLRATSKLNFSDPRAAAALRELVRLSHRAGERASPPELRSALAKHPDLAAFQEIRGLDLELSGDLDGARDAYARAIELEPDEAHALAGMGRVLRARDPGQALAYFDRAEAADPQDPEPKLLAAQALAASGKTDEAARRFDAVLAEHPLEGDAASLRAQLDLDRGVASEETLERARRAVRLGGGAEALDLLSRLHAQRGESEEAKRVADRAQALREKPPSSG